MPGKILNKLTKLSGIAFLTAVILISIKTRIEEQEGLGNNKTSIISCSPLRKDFASGLSNFKKHKNKRDENGNNCPHQQGNSMWINDNKRKGNHTC